MCADNMYKNALRTDARLKQLFILMLYSLSNSAGLQVNLYKVGTWAFSNQTHFNCLTVKMNPYLWTTALIAFLATARAQFDSESPEGSHFETPLPVAQCDCRAIQTKLDQLELR